LEKPKKFAKNTIKGPRVLKLTGFFLHFSPFQIKMKLFSKWLPPAIFVWDFSIFQIKIQMKTVAGGHSGCPKFIFVCISRHFGSKHN
jgi:hypothetical protein